MIRFILVMIFAFVVLVLGSPMLLMEWVVGKINKEKMDISSLRIAQWAFRVVLRMVGVKVTYIGEERVPQDQPVLYVGNHRSIFDVLVTYVKCKNLTGFVAKNEVEHVPFLSTWMRRLYCLFLNRTDIKEGLKTILQAIEYVKSGVSIFIFPEGTRNKNDNELELLEFHAGSFKIAQKTGCPIVPVAMNGTVEIWEKQFPKMKSCHVVVEYCEPIIMSELDKEDKKHIGEYTQNIILEALKKNQELL